MLQIKTLKEELLRLQVDYQKIQLRLVSMQEIIAMLPDFSALSEHDANLLVSGNGLSGDDGDLLNLFRIKGHSMTLSEIITQIKLMKSDLIPLQIINERAFIVRKIKKACDHGLLVKINHSNNTNYVYSLKEWL